jgi:invasion protein IalB
MAKIGKWTVVSAATATVVAGGLMLWGPAIQAEVLKLAILKESQAPAAQKSHDGSTQSAQPSASTDNGASGAPSASRRTEVTTYDSWSVTCTDTVEKVTKKVCRGVLQVAGQNPRRVVFGWIIGRDAKGVLRTAIQTPTGVQIPKGVGIRLGDQPVKTIAYTSCIPQRCEAAIDLDAAAMKKEAAVSSDAVATIYTADGRGVNLKFSIKGIDNVLAAVAN